LGTQNALNWSALVILLVTGTQDWIPQHFFEFFPKIPTHSHLDTKGSSIERFLLQLQPVLAMIVIAWSMISYV
jgi:hypothetical protein